MVGPKNFCDFCARKISDSHILFYTHIILDLCGMFLFLFKMLLWMWYKALTLGKIKNFPCTCGHKAFWHLTMFKEFSIPPEGISWFILVFKYKFEPREKNSLTECLKCAFVSDPPFKVICSEFEPISNLTFLEDKYNKRK